MIGDFHLIIDYIFNLFLDKPNHMPSEHLGPVSQTGLRLSQDLAIVQLGHLSM